jgi:phage-related protein
MNLDKGERSKTSKLIKMLEKYGRHLGPPHSKKIEGDLFELRMIGRIKVRIFYAFRAEEALILHAFIKKTQKLPRQEIDMALRKLRLFDTI